MAITKPKFRLLDAEYEVFKDEESDVLVGQALVTGGVIEKLAVNEDGDDAYRGQVLSALMKSIIKEADRINSNLSIQVVESNSLRMKRFLERFGFRDVGQYIFKRNAGAIVPTHVPY